MQGRVGALYTAVLVPPTKMDRESASTAAGWWPLVACTVPALAFVFAGYGRRWAGDDGFINTRVVAQLMDGNGFVFNAGERCEAVTSAGWVLILWLLGELGLNVDSAGWVLALALSFVGLLSAGMAAERITRPEAPARRTLVLPLGVIAYAGIPVAWDYETSLLENGLGLAFLGVSYFLMAKVVTTERPARVAWTAGFMGLAPLVRPDFALYAAPLLLIALLTTQQKGRIKIAIWAAVPGVTFQIFRMGYFASLVPNTAIAKEAFSARWDQGILYFNNTYDTYYLVIPLVLVLIGLAATLFHLVRIGQVKRALVPASFALSGALHVLYVVRLGGDFMHGRMLLPGLFAISVSVGVVRVSRPSRLAQGAGFAACVAMLAWAIGLAGSAQPEEFVHGILDERRWWSRTAREPNPTNLEDYKAHDFYTGPSWAKRRIAEGCPAGLASLADDIGDYCRRVASPDPLDGRLGDYVDGALLPLNTRSVAPQVVAVFAFRPLGIAGRIMGLRISLTDSFGLADPLAARKELTERGRPGHEKIFDTVWWAAKYTAPDATNDARVSVARRALGCGLLRELHDATHQPLTVQRFVSNLVLSFELHRVRVPTDPQAAVLRFCES